MALNREWHRSNKMQRGASWEQRLIWHWKHSRNCDCRPPPDDFLVEIAALERSTSPTPLTRSTTLKKAIHVPASAIENHPVKNSADAKETVEKFWAFFDKGKFQEAGKLMSPGARVRWPNTKEEFDREGFIRANAEYPGSYSIEVENIFTARSEKDGVGKDTVISVVLVAARDKLLRSLEGVIPNNPTSVHAVSFFTFNRGKIASIVEYWGDDGQPPEWRRELNLETRKDIGEARKEIKKGKTRTLKEVKEQLNL